MLEFEIIKEKQTDIKLPEISITTQVEDFVAHFREFVKSLKTDLGKPAAAGLAAPQCGFNIRVCIVHDDGKWIAAINPRIAAVSNEFEKSFEGCLSWPGRIIEANRYKKVEVEWYDLDSEKVERKEFSGFTSKIWQHEIDHLDGVKEKVLPRDFKTVKNTEKIGRNDPCPCNSGKKFKKCCGG